MRIVLVSHCNFFGNSAMHVFSMAEELQALGHEALILIPDSVNSVEKHRKPSFPIALYEDAIAGNVTFLNEKPVDIIHCWSPREHVRKCVEVLCIKYSAPYVVHMEDNEEQVLSDEFTSLGYDEIRSLPLRYIDQMTSPYRSHPINYRNFVECASGYTCLIEKLLEFKADKAPSTVFWAGFDPEFENLPGNREVTRSKYGIEPDEIVLFYSGNVHHSIAHDVRTLYLAVAALRQSGFKIKLVRTGWNYASLELPDDRLLSASVVELGFVDREILPSLLSMADILVQPGRSDPFNDYRFPSKLPEYLASGAPVILPATNIGHALEDGLHVLKLYDGTLLELIGKIRELIQDPALARRLGKQSREFALANLRWPNAAAKVEKLYTQILSGEKKPTSKASRGPKTDASAGSERPAVGKSEDPVKLIAFYLPQFHPIPENDKWWGKGFTEWTNVARAKPQMHAHRHPRLPTELGYYDLRVAEVMHEQAALATSYGVGGFCFYTYWFNGDRLLERPLDVWLKEGPDFPFCICWANENWSRRWDGSETDLLMEQKYNEGFEEQFIVDMLPLLTDPRYIKVDGAPLLSIYRVSEFPNPTASARALRAAAAKHGIPKLHLVMTQSFGLTDPRPYGLDAAIEFSPPHVGRLLLDPPKIGGVLPTFEGYIEDYVGVAAQSINAAPTDYARYRGCFPMWDNTARRGNRGHVFVNDSPKAYGHWLRFLVNEAMTRREQVAPIIFINAWNEWAEGTYLEPDEHSGRQLLEITQAALVHGVIDFAEGDVRPERERLFTRLVSKIPKLSESF